MRSYFTADLNKRAWKIKKSQNISWGASLRMAIALGDTPEFPAASSVFGTWTLASQYAVAGHFYGLSKAYNEIGDSGRAIAMKRVSNTLYAAYEEFHNIEFRKLIRQKGIKESIAMEMVAYFNASATGGYTPRTLNLIAQGATEYATRVHEARWVFRPLA